MPLWSIGSLDFYFFPPFFLPFLHSFFPCSLLMAEARRETREDEEVQDAAFERDVDLLENVLSGNVQRCTALLQQGADVHFRGMVEMSVCPRRTRNSSRTPLRLG
eukprot:m.879579 g.879579  ORF g.879579 m.879579 type:complete len:105 (-) comp59843_c0_seq32:397-711(-)